MKKLLGILFLIVFASIFGLNAQDRHVIDSLQNSIDKYQAYQKEKGSITNSLPDSTEANLLYSMVLQYWTNDFDTAFYYSQKLLALSRQIGYAKGVGDAYNGMGLINMQMKNYTSSLNYFQKALKVRTEIGDKQGIAWTYNNLGLSYGNQGHFEESILYHFKSLEVKKEIGDRIGMSASYGKIGHDYACLGKFSEAVSNYFSALKIGEEDSDKAQIVRFYGDIGDIYYNEGNYEEALKNYRNQVKIASRIGYTYQIALSENNMGRVLYKLNDDTGSIKYLLASLKTSKEIHDWESVADIYYNLGLVYFDMGNYPMALSNADSSLAQCQVIGWKIYISKVYIELGSIYEKMGKLNDALNITQHGLLLAQQIGARIQMKDACLRLAVLNAEMNNYKDAYRFYAEYVTNLDSLNNIESVKKITTLEMNYSFSKKEDSIKVEQEKADIIRTADIKRKSIITNGIIIISILALLIAFLFINRQRLKHRKDRVIFEKDKQRVESELESSKILLNEYTKSMAEKNKLLEEFKIDAEKFKSLNDKTRTENIEYLNKATILTDEDWNKFKLLFEQVYKDFLARLKNKLPDLTQAETRLVCLTKLSIGTKQMAGILGVSYDTIKKSRHRLRKKLGLSEDDSIDDIVNSI